MDLARLFGASAFRSALYGAGVLCIVFLAGGWLAFHTVRVTFTDDLKRQIDGWHAQLAASFGAGGTEALVADAQLVSAPVAARQQVLALYDASGVLMAGNIDPGPLPLGWHEIKAPDIDRAVGFPAAIMKSVPVGHLTLVLGRSLEARQRVLASLVLSLAGLGTLIAIAMIGIGLVLGLRTARKIDTFVATFERVARGDLSARLPVSSGHDSLDTMARQINRQLERLELLITVARATSSALAHELRTPLARAMLAVERAAATTDNAETSEALAAAEEDLAALAATFDAILRVVRIGASQPGDGEAIDPRALVADMAETFSTVAEERGMRLEAQVPASLPSIRGDPPMLRQMLANLIRNALTHCPAGTGITVAAATDGAGNVVLSVADDGPGIARHDRERALAAFGRLDRDGATPGSGLGLALVRAVAWHHGATLTLADNEPGLRAEVVFPASGA